jgi:alkylhydroperoxidase family enzyme
MIETQYDALIAQLREAARPQREQPRAARGYLETVRQYAYRVTDDQVAELRAGGFSEEEIFELTVAAAVAAGLERLEAGLRTLE